MAMDNDLNKMGGELKMFCIMCFLCGGVWGTWLTSLFSFWVAIFFSFVPFIIYAFFLYIELRLNALKNGLHKDDKLQ